MIKDEIEQKTNLKPFLEQLKTIERPWADLHGQFGKNIRRMNQLEGEIRRLSDSLTEIPETLATNYKDHVKALQSMYMDAKLFSMDDIQKEYAKVKALREKYKLDPSPPRHYTQKHIDASIAELNKLLKGQLNIDKINRDIIEKQRVKSTNEQNEIFTDQKKALEGQTKLERVQLGMMAFEAFEQGITQAAAAGESRYRALAADSAAKGQWVKAGEEFRTASTWNLGGNIAEAGTATLANAGAAYVATGGGVQGKVAAVGVGLITLASQIAKIVQEYQQIQEDLKRLKDQIVTAAAGIPTAFAELQFALEHEAILADPLANEAKIKENLQFSKIQTEHMLANAEGAQADIDALYKKNGYNVENWSDEDVQQLHALKNEYETYIRDYEKYSKLTSAYGAADKAITDYHEAERLQQEEERQRYNVASGVLSENRLFAKDNAARTEFDKGLKAVANADSIKDAIDKLAEIDMSNATESINTQRARIAAYDTTIKELNQKYESGEASADEVEKLVELEQIRNSAMQQLQNDKDLYNSRNDILKDLNKQQKTEVNNLASSASSSQYLADNYGSFSRYFGKTDPSINLIKETNTVLRSILETLRYREGNVGIVYE